MIRLYVLIIFCVLLCSGCTIMKRGAEYEVRQEATKAIGHVFPGKCAEELRSAQTEERLEKNTWALLQSQEVEDYHHRELDKFLDSPAAQRKISQYSIEVLDKELPADYRATLRVILAHFGKGLAAIFAAVMLWLQRKLNNEKRKNGKSSK